MAQFYDYMLAQTLDGNDVFIELEAEVPAVTELKFAIGDVIYVKSTAPDYDGDTKLVKGTDYELESNGAFTTSYTIRDGDKAIIGEVKVAAKAKVEAKGINFHYNSAENKIVVTNSSDNEHMSGFQAKLKEKYDNDVAFTGTFSWVNNKLVYNYQDVKVNFGK